MSSAPARRDPSRVLSFMGVMVDRWFQIERDDIESWRDRFEQWSRNALWTDAAIVTGLIVVLITVVQ